jgi:polyvinyl alcohol dehydrogenase (cytochrome)
VTLKNGKQRLIAGQKSGNIFALDPDNGGRLLWRTKIGRGGIAGGVHWGLAARGEVIYAPVSDTVIKPEDAAQPGSPGLHALDVTTGRTIWFTPAPDACAPARKPACDRGLSAPPTSIPGVVFAGSYDGHLRAYDERSGRVIWDFDTARDFPVLGGGMGRGGSIESAGPVVIDGIVLVNSGYLWGGRMGGNLLLAFSVDGR